MTNHHDEAQRDWRAISGVEGQIPPPREWSGSEGDRSKNSYRPSAYSRLFQLAVCNDDGSPIMQRTNSLLAEILEELRK